MSKQTKFSPEVRERAARLVREQHSEHPSLWAAVESIAPMIGFTSQTLLAWVKQKQVESGERDGATTSERERLNVPERGVKELRRANEMLKLASAFFSLAKLDRRLKSRRPLSISIATGRSASLFRWACTWLQHVHCHCQRQQRGNSSFLKRRRATHVGDVVVSLQAPLVGIAHP